MAIKSTDRVIISTYSPYSSLLCLSPCWLHSSWLFLSHIKMFTNTSPFRNHFVSRTTKSHISFWWHYLGSHAHLTAVIVVIGPECSDGLEESCIAWECRRYFCHKTRGMDDEQRKLHVFTIISSINRWWN